MTVTLAPGWGLIVTIAGLLAVGYAALVCWLNQHPRVGPFCSAHSWLEVVVGNLLIAATAWAIAGMGVMLVVVLLDALWGVPMVLGVLMSAARHQVEADDAAITQAN
jgi:hypothetical protein